MLTNIFKHLNIFTVGRKWKNFVWENLKTGYFAFHFHYSLKKVEFSQCRQYSQNIQWYDKHLHFHNNFHNTHTLIASHYWPILSDDTQGGRIISVLGLAPLQLQLHSPVFCHTRGFPGRPSTHQDTPGNTSKNKPSTHITFLIGIEIFIFILHYYITDMYFMYNMHIYS